MTKNKLQKIIGITGPSGSGKTEASMILGNIGAFVLFADDIGHDVLKSDKVIKKLVSEFGFGILNKKRSVDRKSLGEIAFLNNKNLSTLNSITHPEIQKEVLKKIKSLKDKKLIVVDAALPDLLADISDEIWFIDSPKKIRIKRLLSKGVPKTRIYRIISAQKGRREYLKISGKVIKNNSTLKKFEERILNSLEA